MTLLAWATAGCETSRDAPPGLDVDIDIPHRARPRAARPSPRPAYELPPLITEIAEVTAIASAADPIELSVEGARVTLAPGVATPGSEVALRAVPLRAAHLYLHLFEGERLVRAVYELDVEISGEVAAGSALCSVAIEVPSGANAIPFYDHEGSGVWCAGRRGNWTVPLTWDRERGAVAWRPDVLGRRNAFALVEVSQAKPPERRLTQRERALATARWLASELCRRVACPGRWRP